MDFPVNRTTRKSGKSREAVGLFKDERQLENALDELQESGFDRSEISLLANEETIERRLGHRYEKSTEAGDDPDAPRVAYVSRESLGAVEGALIGTPLYAAAVTSAGIALAAGGPITVAVAAAAVGGGAGALAGAALAGLVDKRYAKSIEVQLEQGGIVVWVTLRDASQKAEAIDVLKKYGGEDVHVHDLRGENLHHSSAGSSGSA